MNDRDRDGPKLEDLLDSVKKMNIRYNILLISDKANQMVKEFKKFGGDDIINTFSMKAGLDADTISQSIVKQIEIYTEQHRNETEILNAG